MSETQKVLAANQSFYHAFNRQDLDLMIQTWASRADDICVHPGWTPLLGPNAIVESWEGIFESGEGLEIELSDVRVEISDELAWVRCRENLFSLSASGVHASRVFATNLFRKIDGRWQMILHHASSLPQEMPLDSLSQDEE